MNRVHALQNRFQKAGKWFLLTSCLLMVLLGIGNSSGNVQASPLVYELVKEVYTDRAISISYPQISNMNDTTKQDRLNQLLKIEALSVLNDYETSELEKLTVKLDYVIGRRTAELLSIRFTGSRYLQGTPYPTALFQSINLDMKEGNKLRLPDVIQVTAEFIEAIKKGRIQAAKDIPWEKLRLENNKLLKAFAQADSAVSSENPARAFSYFTIDGMGVSVAVIHALGDHVEFELPIENLAPFLKPEKANVIK